MIRIGILGGGQLAQMSIQAAISLGLETVIFERSQDTPASRLTPHQMVGRWDDPEAIARFAKLCDAVTLESEFVDAGVLVQLEHLGVPVFASSKTLRLIQDKYLQKDHLANAGIPVPDFEAVESIEEAQRAAAEFGWPCLLKARRDGYDGYGNATLRASEDVAAAWTKLGADSGRQLMVESFVEFERELAVLVLRGRDGEVRTYPVVETVQQNHICHLVRVPASIPSDLEKTATDVAVQAVEAVDGVGVFGVELFQTASGRILFNEMAPRPHNSGHYSIEACVTSQFENHIRAVLGWPLGDTRLLTRSAVMVNTLGTRNGQARPDAVRAALELPGTHVHNYAKREVRTGRKMGHVTVLGDDPSETEARALQAASRISY